MANMTEEAGHTVLKTGVETRIALASDDNGQRSDSPVLRNRAKRAFFRVRIPDQTRPEVCSLDLNTSKHGISSLWSEIQCDCDAMTGIPARETSIKTNLKELGQVSDPELISPPEKPDHPSNPSPQNNPQFRPSISPPMMCAVSMHTFIDMSKEGHANANPTFLFCFFGGGYNVTLVVLSRDIPTAHTTRQTTALPG
ncbi:uncharacterized protein B0T23DRAFT_416716 [Neurospora hispaniola]|uniref:Uncharacterized protein n=1 Tax=Neurospora hispaniola TaxID=588809 RepID=A0AAJ0IF14_9PEZI|nr:hypothetical protein B0T23DRAFT_416716 [Neurospora hispaniola]